MVDREPVSGVAVRIALRRVDTSALPTGRSCPTCQALAAAQVPAPQLRNSPDSGRPPVEQPRPIPAPGGRPDTTAPVDSARLAADADQGDRTPGDREQPRLNLRRGSGMGEVVTEVIGRGITRLTVRCDDEHGLVCIRTNLVRVPTTLRGR